MAAVWTALKGPWATGVAASALVAAPALAKVRRWSIDKRSLMLQDARGRTLLLFQAAGQEG